MKSGVYPRRLKAQAGGHTGRGADPSQGKISYSRQIRDANQPVVHVFRLGEEPGGNL